MGLEAVGIEDVLTLKLTAAIDEIVSREPPERVWLAAAFALLLATNELGVSRAAFLARVAQAYDEGLRLGFVDAR